MEEWTFCPLDPTLSDKSALMGRQISLEIVNIYSGSVVLDVEEVYVCSVVNSSSCILCILYIIRDDTIYSDPTKSLPAILLLYLSCLIRLLYFTVRSLSGNIHNSNNKIE